MQVILLERVPNLGVLGDEVKVKDGFARNFLLPQRKALRATDANRKRFEVERVALEKVNDERRDAASGEAGKVDGKSFVIIRQAGESGQLYGSVVARDIAEVVSDKTDVKIVRGQVSLRQPIKTLGVHTVPVQLHPEVEITVSINVARTTDEAERQERGEDVITSQADEDRAVAEAQAAELFEAGQEPEDLKHADADAVEAEPDEKTPPA